MFPRNEVVVSKPLQHHIMEGLWFTEETRKIKTADDALPTFSQKDVLCLKRSVQYFYKTILSSQQRRRFLSFFTLLLDVLHPGGALTGYFDFFFPSQLIIPSFPL
jgi:hypothetical protein